MEHRKDAAFLNPDADFAYLDDKVSKLLGCFRKFFNCAHSQLLGKAIKNPMLVRAPGYQLYKGPLYGANGSFLPMSKDRLSYLARPQRSNAHGTNYFHLENGSRKPLLPVSEECLFPQVNNCRKLDPLSSQPEMRIPVRYDDIYDFPCDKPRHGENKTCLMDDAPYDKPNHGDKKRKIGHGSDGYSCLMEDEHLKTILEDLTSFWFPDAEVHSPIPENLLKQQKMNTFFHEGRKVPAVSNAIKRPSLVKPKCPLPRNGAATVGNVERMPIPFYQRAAGAILMQPNCSLPRNGGDPNRNVNIMPIPSYQRAVLPTLMKPKCSLPGNGADRPLRKCQEYAHIRPAYQYFPSTYSNLR